MAEKMYEIVTDCESEEKKRFYTELAKHRHVIELIFDQTKPNPAWMEVEESFLELKDAFVTWQAFKSLLDIHDDR